MGFAGLRHTTQVAVETDHGRLKIRRGRASDHPAVPAWLDPKWTCCGGCTVPPLWKQSGATTARSTGRGSYLSSLPGDAEGIRAAVRRHRNIENRLNEVLHVAFREDTSRARVGHVAENSAVLRRPALNPLRQEGTVQVGDKARGAPRPAGARLPSSTSSPYDMRLPWCLRQRPRRTPDSDLLRGCRSEPRATSPRDGQISTRSWPRSS